MAEKVEFRIDVQLFGGGSGFDLTPIYAEARNLLGIGPDDPIFIGVVGGSESSMIVVFDDNTTSSSQETDCPAGPATISGSLTFTPENEQFTFSGTATIVKTVEVVDEPPGDPRVFTTCSYSFSTSITGDFAALFEEAVANQDVLRTADFLVAGDPVFAFAQGTATIPLAVTAQSCIRQKDPPPNVSTDCFFFGRRGKKRRVIITLRANAGFELKFNGDRNDAQITNLKGAGAGDVKVTFAKQIPTNRRPSFKNDLQIQVEIDWNDVRDPPEKGKLTFDLKLKINCLEEAAARDANNPKKVLQQFSMRIEPTQRDCN